MIIPYDHAATFEMTGRPGNIAQGVINIASDGVFVATAIGYGFEEQRARPINSPVAPAFAPAPARPPVIPGDVALGQLPLAALIEGFRISPRFAPLVFGAAPNRVFSDQQIARELFFGSDQDRSVLERVKSPEEISFFFSIVDSGTGREFQDQPAHNLASLGKSNGERPFRLLARPLSFMPRSTLRLQIAERTEGARGTLFIVLYGYKILGAARCPDPVVRSWRATPQGSTVEIVGEPDARAIPFDYVTTFELTGNPGAVIEDEISVNAGDGFVATSVGYGLAVEETGVSVAIPDPNNLSGSPLQPVVQGWRANNGINLAEFPLRFFPPDALLDGLRIRQNFLRVALGDNGSLADRLPFALISRVFERINSPEDVSFRYAIFDGGTGHELQNRPLNNVAGLGIANGDRPFKKLARPMSFLPRSTIRVQVEERFGRGTLFIAFQGYKLLGGAPQGGR
ncbi:MAG: hypothetical protein ACREA2_18465 [Blastocatellia bacterium]